MKKLFLILLSFSLSFLASGQLKLGNNLTTIDGNSLLELESSTKLLVLSSASLTSTTSRSPYSATLKTGAIVFNTNASITAGSSSYPISTGGTGLYVWDGSGWVSLKWTTPDASLLDRANHTGTQTAATISDFNSSVASTAALKANNLSDLGSATTARTNLGATTVGSNLFTLTNPTAVTFPRFNADNTVSVLDAATFRSAIGAGTSSTNGTVTSVSMSVPSFLSVSGSPITSSGTLAVSLSGTALPIANGGTGATTAATARTNLGATTVGSNLFTLTNPAAITFPRFNADNTVSALDAATFRTAIGAGTSSTTGTVTSVGGTGSVSGLSLSGTVTTTGNLTLGGTLAVTPSNFASQTANTILAAPNGAAGVPTFRSLVAADIPTLNQNTTGTAANVTGTVAIANGGTGATTAATARSNLGATTVGANLFTLTNPAAITFPRFNADNTVSALDAATFRTAIGAGTSSTTGTVTSVGGTGTVSGLSLSGTVTTTGNLTLGGTLAVTPSNFSSQTANTILAAPNGSAGVPTFRALVAADIPTLNQNTTGTAANVTGTVAIANGGTGATTASTARTNLGATTVGGNLFTLTNPAAITFPRFNADNTVSALDAATFRTAIGAGTSSTTGTVTSVGGTGTVSGLSLSGTVTSTGNLTLGGTLAVTPSNFASQTANTILAAPNGSAGVPTFRALVAADIPTLNQNTTGTAANVTGTVAIANGGTGSTTGAGLLSGLTSGYVPRATGSNTLGNGVIQDNGSQIGIGTGANASYRVYNNGAYYSTGDGTAVAYYMAGGTAIRALDNNSIYFDFSTAGSSGDLIFRASNFFTEKVRVRNAGGIKIPQLASDPSGGSNSEMYYNTTSHKFRGYANGSWVDLH